ncbi:MAG: serine hydrolase domain-containing protein [Cytophagales bacterium]|nr:serine hydrolase domain-containing protein [Cytophagales bacterium]
MKYYIAGILLVGFTLVSCGQKTTTYQDQIAATNRLFKNWNNNHTPGATIGIIKDGNLIYSKGYGMANLEHDIPNDEHTIFNIASNSKQFTAACLSILELRGEIEFTQNVKTFFPEFPSYFEKITIDHLLHHTSGLRDFTQIHYLSGLRPDDYYDDQDIQKWINSQQELNFQPGEKYLYSNSGYWLLGQIIEKVSGLSLAKFAEQEIFEPLNMSGTLFYDNNTLVVKNRASGYFANRSGAYRHIYSNLEHTGNGGVFSSLADLKKWDDEYYNREVLKDDFWELMGKPGMLNNRDTIPYSGGLILGTHKGLSTMDHGGRAPGYLSNIVRFPGEKLTIIILANSSNLNASRICYDVADIFLANVLNKEPAPPSELMVTTTLKSELLEKYAGHYWSTENNISRRIVMSNDTLKYERSRGRVNALVPINSTSFKMLGTPAGMNVKVAFEVDGASTKMRFVENGKEVDQWDSYIPTDYTPEELSTFSGVFYSPEIKTSYELQIEEPGQLFLYINGRRTVPLRPVMKNLFSSPIGVFRFVAQNNEGIVAFRISTPRVKNLLFEKS